MSTRLAIRPGERLGQAVYVGTWPAGSPEWLAARRATMNGSEIAAVMGISPYESAFSLWHRKAGNVGDVEQDDVMYWGNRLEDVVREEFNQRNDRAFAPVGLFRHHARTWQGGGPDGIDGDELYEGKALDIDTPMLTVAGWSTMGELQVGDEVFHPDGHPVRVLAAHPVRRNRTCYRVTTTDGRSVVADAEHLWTVRLRNGRWRTLTTETLHREELKTGHTYRFVLPHQRALVSKPIDLPVDPYLLGVWLGDGTRRFPRVSVGDEDLAETVANLEAVGARVNPRPSRTCWTLNLSLPTGPSFGARCRALGVWDEKHVPDLYLAAGTEQRAALLQGLLDTDGSITRGQVEFCATNPRLADAVLYLARSLGWRAVVNAGPTHLGGTRWRVRFTPTQDGPAPFRLQRKLDRVRRADRATRSPRIASIREVPSRPVRCIKVDSPDGLYVAGRDLVPTHNTARYDEGWGEPGSDEIPVHYRAQVLWYLDVFGYRRCHVAVLVAGSDYREYLVEASPDEAESMRAKARAFLDTLDAGVPPPIDGHEATYEVVRELHPDIQPERVEIPAHIAVPYLQSLAAAQAATTEKRRCSALVVDAMGNAKDATYCGDVIARRQAKNTEGSIPYLVAERGIASQFATTEGSAA